MLGIGDRSANTPAAQQCSVPRKCRGHTVPRTTCRSADTERRPKASAPQRRRSGTFVIAGKSAQPRYLDTSILGSVRLQIKLAGTNVLVGPVTRTPTYGWKLDTIQALCQVVSVDDGSYSQIVQQRLSNGGVKIPFKYYLTFQGNVGIAGQNLRMNVSSQSVDGVWATFQQALTGATSYTANGYDSQLRTSTYFTRCATNMSDSVFSVNGVGFPSIPLTPNQIWNENMHNMGLSCDMVGQLDKSFVYAPGGTITPGVNAIQSNAFFHYFKFNVDNDEGTSRLSSGLDTRGSASTLTWTTTGNSGSLLPVCFVECTGIMEVGPNRQVSVVCDDDSQDYYRRKEKKRLKKKVDKKVDKKVAKKLAELAAARPTQRDLMQVAARDEINSKVSKAMKEMAMRSVFPE
ncbi:hypothetical protein KFL_010010010 [Klebsormidium nitens]|uniref:Uncharacterized protein n=1 Tax=Klebsormidium nitens TaxID=105231 RepID=A0A1Y1INZ9_KLENI|nr:hypothetical protein KFL_010010010 [Klebsormidium nitens]|eukprot:GAQ92383.1 hypothetical protein KFL_010010010 [Klebsormidium nitens]